MKKITINGDEQYIEDPFESWDGLYRTSYLVLPKLALIAMPVDWQNAMISLLDEAYDKHKLETPNYSVLRADPTMTIVKKYDEEDHSSRDYEFTTYQTDPWADYRHGNVKELCPQFIEEPDLFTDDDKAEAEKYNVLGRHYFSSRRISKKIRKHIDVDLIKGAFADLIKKIGDEVENVAIDALQNDMVVQDYLWSTSGRIIEALVSGEQWALEQWLLSNRWDCENLRKKIIDNNREQIESAVLKDALAKIEKQDEEIHQLKLKLENYRRD